MKIFIFSTIILSLCLIGITSCSEEDEKATFVEIKDPVKDNPVDKIEWLSSLKDRSIQKMEEEADIYLRLWKGNEEVFLNNSESYIKTYTLHGDVYYFLYTPSHHTADVKTSWIYDTRGNLKITIGGVEGNTNQEFYHDFSTNAVFLSKIWSYQCVIK